MLILVSHCHLLTKCCGIAYHIGGDQTLSEKTIPPPLYYPTLSFRDQFTLSPKKKKKKNKRKKIGAPSLDIQPILYDILPNRKVSTLKTDEVYVHALRVVRFSEE